MLAYAASRPVVGTRRSSPNSMLFVISAHVAAIALVMSAKMDLPLPFKTPPIKVDLIDAPRPPVAEPRPQPPRPSPPADPTLSRPDPLVEVPDPTDVRPAPLPDPGPAYPTESLGPTDSSGAIGSGAQPIAATPAVLLTPPAELRPPYPPAKEARGEEADLKLRLTIDASGRVIAVEPIGRADSTFLSATRRHILAHWRYRPATSDGRGVVAQLVVTLRFRLDD